MCVLQMLHVDNLFIKTHQPPYMYGFLLLYYSSLFLGA